MVKFCNNCKGFVEKEAGFLNKKGIELQCVSFYFLINIR